jgi:hypothetical protein
VRTKFDIYVFIIINVKQIKSAALLLYFICLSVMLNSLNIHSHLYHFLLNKIINGENEMNLIGEICLLNNFNSENNIYTIFKLKRYIFNEFILNSSVNVWNDGENKSRSQAQSQNVLYPLLTVFHK